MFKIAITGPESTGKSTLAEKLAHHFNTDFIPEYSRTYLENFEGQYTEDDVVEIYRKTLEQMNVPFEIVNGDNEERVSNAIKIIKKYLHE